MTTTFSTRCAATALLLVSALAQGQAAEPPPGPPPDPLNLYAVEIRTGPAWDAARPPHEQAFFKEHSANLKRLRDAGQLVLGARYADKGLVIVQARSPAEARALIDADPAMRERVFVYELSDFNVFYGGAVQPKARAPRTTAPAGDAR